MGLVRERRLRGRPAGEAEDDDKAYRVGHSPAGTTQLFLQSEPREIAAHPAVRTRLRLDRAFTNQAHVILKRVAERRIGSAVVFARAAFSERRRTARVGGFAPHLHACVCAG